MPKADMLTVFTYDVGADRRRRRIARILEREATRVQYSVFEARLSSHRTAAIGQRVAAELGPGDSLRVYAIGATGESRSRTYGDATPIVPSGDYWIV